MATKRLLMISSFAESLINFRLALMQDAIAAGFEVHACAPDLTPEINAELNAHGITTHDITLVRTGLNPFKDLATVHSVYRLIRQLRPSHTLAYTIKPVVYGSIAARMARVSRIGALITGLGYTFMQADSLRQKVVSKIAHALYEVALNGVNIAFFQNPDDRDLFVDNRLVDRAKTRLVNGSGIDIEQFSQQPLNDFPPFHFLMIGRIIKDKGVVEYAQAAQQIKQRYPHAHFHLVGWLDSNPNAIQQSQLDEWIASGAITFHGRLADVREVIQNCHVYVLPSYREGTPRTVLEAMAVGRAIITTNAPGCKETIEDGVSGQLIDVADIPTLVAAIERYIKAPEKIAQHGQAARERAIAVYDVHKVNQQMLDGLVE
ncbi:glycosyltransferase family 4 protein [Alteromonas sp. ASW11-36]|uniref:Glycosyltransferase family 4 protein n=1 Tax=Alteromonas arenosi TaxID=3055817 RepID=A0ABT7SZ00_9ALTE|nr:glycosyltransferase family 4 protein [Alteromonas sp. ASW11-36]MDM7861408.1 glycosyltransferase family 4 protein [Alteromonas sp. ASW11-36]